MSKGLTPAEIMPIYPYVPEGGAIKNPKRNRDTEGYVISGPPNFYTARLKKGLVGKGTTFAGPIPHVDGNDWEARRAIMMTDRAYHCSKLQEKPFSSQAKKN
jgi:hypothetical protein